MDFLANINLNGIGEIQNANIQNLGTAPTTNLKAGRLYFNTTSNTLYVYNGSEWLDALVQGSGATYTGANGVDVSGSTIQLNIASGANAGNVALTADTNGLAASAPTASTSQAGLIEIATDLEASTGTSETLAVNPKQLASAVSGKITLTSLSIASGSANYLGYDNTTGEFSANVDTTVTSSSTNLVTSGAVDTAIANALTGALKYQGTWTATGQLDYSSITLPVKKGYMYAVSGNAIIDGVEWNSGDYLVINKNVASSDTITSADVEKIDNTEASDIVRLSATQTLTNKTIDADDNTISDLTTSNLKSGVLQTTVRATSSASDTSIPSEKAVASAINGMSKVYTETNPALTVVSGVCTWTVTHSLGSNVAVHVYNATSGAEVACDKTLTSSTVATVSLLASANISAGTYKVVVIGA